MKITIVLLMLFTSVTSYAYDRNCSRIMDEPFKEYKEYKDQAKDEHSAFYVVVSNHQRSLDYLARLNF